MSESSKFVLEAVGISKRFGNFTALDNVSLRLSHGHFHALLGENGAGKSTLVKCIMGYYQPDDGAVVFGDKQQAITNPHDAMALGIGMVYQHFTLIPNMTVAENLVLARPHLPSVIDWRAEKQTLQEKMARMPFKIDLDAPIDRLAAGEKQKVEIIKQLMLDIKVLILDEPTSVLTPNEADEVLGQIKRMTREFGLSVLIITHKFREVMNFADEVTVLRKGQYAGAAAVVDVDPPKLAAMMVGREVAAQPLERSDDSNKQTVLELRGLQVEDDTGMPAVSNFSLSVSSGEIVGIAGVSGNGQRELVQVLAGQRDAQSGEVWVHGERYLAKRTDMRRHKFYCLPEEPLRNACVSSMSVADNLALRQFDRAPFSKNNWLLNRRAVRRAALDKIQEYGIRTSGPDNAIGNLSGGNVQRTVLARELSEAVEVLVVANPCFGLDFGAVAFIHTQIMLARNRGAAVLLVSEDLDEVLELSDRVVVISAGQIVYETTPDKADLTTIGQYMAGH